MNESPPVQPLLTYATPVPPRRPTSVLVLAIIGIVIALLALAGAFATLVFFVGVGGFQNGLPLWVTPWRVLQIVMSVLLYGTLVWVSVAAIRMRPRARVAFIRWAWTLIAWQLIQVAVQVLTTVRDLMAYRASTGDGPTFGELLPSIMARHAVSLVLTCIFPVFVLLWMRKPHVRAAFERVQQGGTSAVPVAGVAPATVEPAVPS